MLIDGRDSVLAPYRLVEEGLRRARPESFRRRRIAPDVVPGILIDQQVALGVDGAVVRLPNALLIARNVIVVADDKQRRNANTREARGVPVVLRRRGAPRGGSL